jgi:hypothetical protein
MKQQLVQEILKIFPPLFREVVALHVEFGQKVFLRNQRDDVPPVFVYEFLVEPFEITESPAYGSCELLVLGFLAFDKVKFVFRQIPK